MAMQSPTQILSQRKIKLKSVKDRTAPKYKVIFKVDVDLQNSRNAFEVYRRDVDQFQSTELLAGRKLLGGK